MSSCCKQGFAAAAFCKLYFMSLSKNQNYCVFESGILPGSVSMHRKASGKQTSSAQTEYCRVNGQKRQKIYQKLQKKKLAFNLYRRFVDG